MNEGINQISFEPDLNSPKKKGVHKPIFAPTFINEPEIGEKPNKIYLLINPYSGRKRGRKVGEKATQLLENAGISVESIYSDYAGHLVDISSALSINSQDCIAVVGGDGSLSEVITGRMRTNSKELPRFAVIPAGTGNAQGTGMGIKNTEDAIERIISGRTQSIDLAEVKLTSGSIKKPGKSMIWYSHNLVTWGLGVDSTILAEKIRWAGPIRYDVGIVVMILFNRRRKATLTIDDTEIIDDFTLFLIQNTQTGGSGLQLGPGASVDDGLMDLGILKRMTRRSIFKAFSMLQKEARHVYHPSVKYHRFEKLKIETDEPTAINIDGELIGCTPLEMRVLPNSIKIFV